MRRDAATYLCDMLLACEKILEYTRGMNATQFAASTLIQDAVILRFQVVGEAAVQLRHHFPSEALLLGNIQEVVDFRNYLVHRYHSIEAEVVWEIVQTELEELLARIRLLLGEAACR